MLWALSKIGSVIRKPISSIGRFYHLEVMACLGELHSNFPSSAPWTPCQTRLALETPDLETPEKNLELGIHIFYGVSQGVLQKH